MFEWLQNKFYVMALIIYVIPGFIGFLLFTYQVGHPFLGFFDFAATFLTCILFSPLMLFSALTYNPYYISRDATLLALFGVVIPYYAISYGLLLLWKFKENQISIF